MERVGFIGIGVMGKPMCLNLRTAGFPLTIYARRPEAAREVVEAGAVLVDSSRAVAEVSDVVITMLSCMPARPSQWRSTANLWSLVGGPSSCFSTATAAPLRLLYSGVRGHRGSLPRGARDLSFVFGHASGQEPSG